MKSIHMQLFSFFCSLGGVWELSSISISRAYLIEIVDILVPVR